MVNKILLVIIIITTVIEVRPDDTNILLWWTPLTGNYTTSKVCGKRKCTITDDRSTITSPKLKAILFYGSDFEHTDLPLPRAKDHIWSLFHEESLKNQPYLSNPVILKYFNYTSTFSRWSDFPLTLQYLDNLETLTTTKYFLTVEEKNKIKAVQKLAPIAYVQSHCDPPSGREQYVKELMNYIDIDSYGACLRNKEWPETLTENYLSILESDELYNAMKPYKFFIAFENAVCNDYITEKLWRPLMLGIVPIYFGSPTVEDWLPNNKSAILVEEFWSPKDLADYIKYLDENDDAYNEYLSHKYMANRTITNESLLYELEERMIRKYDLSLSAFECFMCELSFQNTTKPKFATAEHYDCGNKVHLPKMETDMTNFLWHNILEASKCEARTLDHFLSLNKPFTSEEFEKRFKENLRFITEVNTDTFVFVILCCVLSVHIY